MNNNEIKKMIKNSDPTDLLSKLGPDEKQFLNTLLNDKSARDKFLSSKEAAEIMKIINGKG